MILSLTALILLVLPLLLIEGFFSGSEIALLSADRLGLKAATRKGSTGAHTALDLISHPERILSTTLLMTSICVVGISSLIAIYIMSRMRINGELVSVAITSPLIVLIGELIPKTIYRRHADKLAVWVAPVIWWTYWIFFPLTRVLSSYTMRLSKILGPLAETLAGKKRTTREELLTMLSYTKKETEIKSSEKRMIKRILDFKDTEAKHALIPLVKVEAIEDTANIKEAINRFQQHRHSRMPVYSERVDNIIGILEIADLFGASDLNQQIRNYITPAHYVAETQALEDLLLEMRQENDEMVVIVDEYGGAIGILTFEDIVEEIVGEISDEYDAESALWKQIGEACWLLQAKMEIQQINEQLHFELPEGDYETLSGFLLQQFGRIPEPGYELYFDTPVASLKFTIRKASERHIESVVIQRTATKDMQHGE